jgi:hypothetical protein
MTVLLLLATSACTYAEGISIPGVPSELTTKAVSTAGTLGFRDTPPITTSFADADHRIVLPDSFSPPHFDPLTSLPLGSHGGFLLRPGAFEMNVQSYCLHAGTHGPSKGEGYLYAPLLGPKRDAVWTILKRSGLHPEIEQHDIQVLIWGILARTKVSDMPLGPKRAAVTLLTPKEIFDLDGGALGHVPPQVWDRALAEAPPPVRAVMAAEAALRDMFRVPSATYADFERVAVLGGELAHTSEDVPSGRWSAHPGGFYVRYLPSGYPRTKLQVYVPRPKGGARTMAPTGGSGGAADACSTAVAEYDPADDVAVPANTSSQRLSQSARGQDGWVPGSVGMLSCSPRP